MFGLGVVTISNRGFVWLGFKALGTDRIHDY